MRLNPPYHAPFLVLLAGVASLLGSPAHAIELPFIGNPFGFGGDASETTDATPAPSDRPGTRQWWSKHKKKARFVPGNGYRVEGFDGYYDANGKPMDAGVDEITIKLTKDDNLTSGLIPGLDPKAHAKQVREAIGLGPDQRAAQAFLDEGVALFGEKKYSKAAGRFKKAADRWPGSAIEATALFNLGETYFWDDQYDESADAFTTLLDKHPGTNRLNDAVERLWKIAQYWEKAHFADPSSAPFGLNMTVETRPTFDTIGHAVRLYEVIRLNDPTGPRADDAIMATAGIHFARQRYSDADYHYTLLRREYPRSEHQFEAHLLGLQAKLEEYHGPDYDGSPLKEAERLEEQTRLNFAGRLNEEERERLRNTRAQLAAQIEERDLRMADYYEGIEHHGSARIYLQALIDNNPDSPGAQKARERLAKLDGLPDVPPVPMEWFVNLFPRNKRFESINTIEELSTDAPRTMIADGSKEVGEGGATTR